MCASVKFKLRFGAIGTRVLEDESDLAIGGNAAMRIGQLLRSMEINRQLQALCGENGYSIVWGVVHWVGSPALRLDTRWVAYFALYI